MSCTLFSTFPPISRSSSDHACVDRDAFTLDPKAGTFSVHQPLSPWRLHTNPQTVSETVEPPSAVFDLVLGLFVQLALTFHGAHEGGEELIWTNLGSALMKSLKRLSGFMSLFDPFRLSFDTPARRHCVSERKLHCAVAANSTRKPACISSRVWLVESVEARYRNPEHSSIHSWPLCLFGVTRPKIPLACGHWLL